MKTIEPLESRMLFSVGEVDHSFIGGGQLSFASTDTPKVTLVQNNGEFIVGGTSQTSGTSTGFLERFRANGKLDTSFGNNGRIDMPADEFKEVDAMALASHGELIIAGLSSDGSAMLARFTNKGKLDTHFGTAGLANLGDNLSDFIVKVEANQSIVVGADLNTFPTEAVAGANFEEGEILHVTKAGALDTTFGVDGAAVNTLGVEYVIGDLQVFYDGKIEAYFVNTAVQPNVEAGGLDLFDANGALDTTFQQGTGINANPPFTYRFLPDTTFITLMDGATGGTLAEDYAPIGTPNTKFGEQGGSATLPFPTLPSNGQLGSQINADRILVETGYKLLVIQTSTNGSTTQTSIGSLTTKGKIDKTFGKTGVVAISPAGVIAVSPSGEIMDAVTDGHRLLLLETTSSGDVIQTIKI